MKLWEAITVIMEKWISESWKGERVTLLHKGKSRWSLNYNGIAIGSNYIPEKRKFSGILCFRQQRSRRVTILLLERYLLKDLNYVLQI